MTDIRDKIAVYIPLLPNGELPEAKIQEEINIKVKDGFLVNGTFLDDNIFVIYFIDDPDL